VLKQAVFVSKGDLLQLVDVGGDCRALAVDEPEGWVLGAALEDATDGDSTIDMFLNPHFETRMKQDAPIVDVTAGVSTGTGTAGTSSYDDVVIDFQNLPAQELDLDANTAFTHTGTETDRSKIVTVLVNNTTTGTLSLAFDDSWEWLSSEPTDIAGGASAILSLTSWGSRVVAAWGDLS
jgi:hypothetical protein